MVKLGFYTDLNVWTTLYSTSSTVRWLSFKQRLYVNGHIGFSFTNTIQIGSNIDSGVSFISKTPSCTEQANDLFFFISIDVITLIT